MKNKVLFPIDIADKSIRNLL